jgi:hypothetical protein
MKMGKYAERKSIYNIKPNISMKLIIIRNRRNFLIIIKLSGVEVDGALGYLSLKLELFEFVLDFILVV